MKCQQGTKGRKNAVGFLTCPKACSLTSMPERKGVEGRMEKEKEEEEGERDTSDEGNVPGCESNQYPKRGKKRGRETLSTNENP